MKNLLILLALGVGIVIGLLVDLSSEEHPSNSVPASQNTDSSAGSHSAIESDASNPAELAGTEAREAVKELSLEQKLARMEALKKSKSLSNTIATLDLIASMSEAELKGMLTDASKQGFGSIDDFTMPYYTFLAWVEKDPDSAYDFYLNDAQPMQTCDFLSSAVVRFWRHSRLLRRVQQ